MYVLVSVVSSAMQSAVKVKDWCVLERALRYVEGTPGVRTQISACARGVCTVSVTRVSAIAYGLLCL